MSAWIETVDPEDATGIELPRACRALTHDTLDAELDALPKVKRIDLRAHHAAILLKPGR